VWGGIHLEERGETVTHRRGGEKQWLRNERSMVLVCNRTGKKTNKIIITARKKKFIQKLHLSWRKRRNKKVRKRNQKRVKKKKLWPDKNDVPIQ